jgi:hypothetical protein
MRESSRRKIRSGNAHRARRRAGPDHGRSKSNTPIASDGNVMNVKDAAEVSAWYAKWFGAKISKGGSDVIGDIPGARIVFHVTKEPIAPTKGHSLALLGFEVKNLQNFVERYQEAGGKLDTQIATASAAACRLSNLPIRGERLLRSVRVLMPSNKQSRTV